MLSGWWTSRWNSVSPLSFHSAMRWARLSHLAGRVPFVPAEPDKDKRSRDPHVQGVPAPSRVADDRAYGQASSRAHISRLGRLFKPFGVPKFHRHPKFLWPFFEVGCHGGGMLGRKVGRELDEGGAEFVSGAKSPSMKSSVGPSQSLPRKCVTIGETRTKREPIRHCSGPFRHAVGGVDAVKALNSRVPNCRP